MAPEFPLAPGPAIHLQADHTMAHDPVFEQRIAKVLAEQGARAEPKKMFGGVAFMVNGNMSVGITNKGDFTARFDRARHAEVGAWPGAKPMTFGRGDMPGFLFVDPSAVATARSLTQWVRLSLEYIATLPAKPSSARAGAGGRAVKVEKQSKTQRTIRASKQGTTRRRKK